MDLRQPSAATPSARPARRPHRFRWATVGLATAALLGLAACTGPSPTPTVLPADPVAEAKATVATSEAALATAKTESVAADAALCSAASGYLTSLDRYGDVLVQSAVTVGDVKTAGADLLAPRAETVAAAEQVKKSRDAVAQAEQELAAAEVALANAEARAAGQTPTATTSPAKPSPSPAEVPASVERVRQAEADLASTSAGITDSTPLRKAAEEFNSAVVALEMAWLQLLNESGCLSDEQQKQAVEAAQDYTRALQKSLDQVGRYDGEIDGIYGPQTVAGVKDLQEANKLPATGVMDKATEVALRAELLAKGLTEAAASIASTAVLQQRLTTLGYYTGPVDGIWSDELTASIKAFQQDLGVDQTGKIDAATIDALENAIKDFGKPTPTSKPTPTPTKSPTPEPEPSGSPTATTSG